MRAGHAPLVTIAFGVVLILIFFAMRGVHSGKRKWIGSKPEKNLQERPAREGQKKTPVFKPSRRRDDFRT